MRPRAYGAALLCLLLPTGVWAQHVPSVQDVNKRLRSSSITTVAWAAFEAGAFGIVETIPALSTALQSPPRGSAQQREYLDAVILDALVQMPFWPAPPGVVLVPPTVVATHFTRWPIQTLAVLGRIGPAADAVVLHLLRGWPEHRDAVHGDEAWFAIANLLVVRAPVGFAALLLREATFTLRVSVVDQESPTGRGGGSSMSRADGIAQKPEGFPPHAEYQWSPALGGSVLLASGPRAIFYRRVVTWQSQYGVAWGHSPDTPSDADRLAYLSAVAGMRDPFALRSHADLTVAWNGPDAFLRDVRQEQRRIASAYQALLERLVANGRLTPDEAKSLPLHLETTTTDSRLDRRMPLPSVPFP